MKKDYIKYLLSLLMFGSNGIFVMQISLTSYEIVFLRTLIGSMLLIAIFFISKSKFTFLKHKKQFAILMISGIAMGACWMFLYEAYKQIGVNMSSLAYYCGPVIIMVLSPLIFKEKLGIWKIVGFVTVLFGVFLVNGEVFLEGKTFWGLFCGGMSAISYAVSIMLNKKAKDIKGMENAMFQLFSAFITVAIFVGIKQGYAIKVENSDWIYILIISLLNTGISCYLYFSSIGNLPVQTVAIGGYFEPLSSIILSTLILKETMLPIQIFGGALIVCGAIFGEYMSIRQNKIGWNKVERKQI